MLDNVTESSRRVKENQNWCKDEQELKVEDIEESRKSVDSTRYFACDT